MWRAAWSDPSDPSQSTLRFEKVASFMAATLYHARSRTLSHLLSLPCLVMTPGLLANVRRFPTVHSSSLLAQLDGSVPVGDQVLEWVLKSPMTSVGVVASRSSARRVSRLDLSLTLW